MLKIGQAELRRVEEMTSSMPMSLFTTNEAFLAEHSHWLSPAFMDAAGPYMERFEATGFRPEEVDYVFCTHLHGDHCGWNTRLQGDRLVPTFPNARYVMVRREFERWDPRRPGHKAVRDEIRTV